MKKSEARLVLESCGLSRNDPFIVALSPRLVISALAMIPAAYAVLFIVRAVVCNA